MTVRRNAADRVVLSIGHPEVVLRVQTKGAWRVEPRCFCDAIIGTAHAREACHSQRFSRRGLYFRIVLLPLSAT
jgi:hypothetical protein